MGQFAVIGLGQFGSATSLELMKLGHSVLGVDSDNKLVDKYADQLTHAAIADVTDKPSLEELGLDTYDVRSEEHTSELQSLMCNSYAVFSLQKKRSQVPDIYQKAHIQQSEQ